MLTPVLQDFAKLVSAEQAISVEYISGKINMLIPNKHQRERIDPCPDLLLCPALLLHPVFGSVNPSAAQMVQ